MAKKIIPTVNYCYICGQRVRREHGEWVHASHAEGHMADPRDHDARTCGKCHGTHRCQECDGKGAVGMIMCPECDGDGGCACVHPRERGNW